MKKWITFMLVVLAGTAYAAPKTDLMPNVSAPVHVSTSLANQQANFEQIDADLQDAMSLLCCMDASASGCCGDVEICATATSCNDSCQLAFIMATNKAHGALNMMLACCP